MIKKFSTWLAGGTIASLLLATLTVVPVTAQSTSGNGQGSGSNQSQNQGQDQNQGQNQNQDSCAAFAQSLGQGMNQGNSQNGNNGNNQSGNNNGNGQNGNNGQAALGTGPGNAATPLADCWLSIGPGQKLWYKFHAGARSNKGDEKNNQDNANGVDDSDAAIVQLTMDTPGCVAFEIWTLDRLNAPPRVGSDATSDEKRKDKEIARGPVGAGSPEFAVVDGNIENNSNNNSSSGNNGANSDKNQNRARLIWRGGSTVPENFYIAVRNLRSDFTCSYRLSVAGSTVSFPGTNNGGNNSANGNSNNSGNNNNNNNGSNNSNNNNGSNNGNTNNG